mmetsp:Transcript_35518/g.73956  ORF Transcript_35518/g.73956 Transcript_35518/m.73956 type:complete len:207 (+) Transcript_35518:362-982(+)
MPFPPLPTTKTNRKKLMWPLLDVPMSENHPCSIPYLVTRGPLSRIWPEPPAIPLMLSWNDPRPRPTKRIHSIALWIPPEFDARARSISDRNFSWSIAPCGPFVVPMWFCSFWMPPPVSRNKIGSWHKRFPTMVALVSLCATNGMPSWIRIPIPTINQSSTCAKNCPKYVGRPFCSCPPPPDNVWVNCTVSLMMPSRRIANAFPPPF